MKVSFHIEFLVIVAAVIVIPSMIYAESASKVTQMEHPTIYSNTAGANYAFVVKVRDEITAILNKVRNKITDNGGKFEGDTEHGTFGGRSALGTIKGEYVSISKNEIEIVITDKPFIVPYKTIEYRVREYLN